MKIATLVCCQLAFYVLQEATWLVLVLRGRRLLDQDFAIPLNLQALSGACLLV